MAAPFLLFLIGSDEVKKPIDSMVRLQELANRILASSWLSKETADFVIYGKKMGTNGSDALVGSETAPLAFVCL